MWEKMNGLERFFRVYGILEIIGGVILAFIFGPGDAGSGYTWKAVAFTTSIICFSVGLIFGIIFIAVGSVIYYLRNTMETSIDINSNLRNVISLYKESAPSAEKQKTNSISVHIKPLVLEENGLTKEQQRQADLLFRGYGKIAYEEYVQKTLKENKNTNDSVNPNRSPKFNDVSDEDLRAKYDSTVEVAEKEELRLELVARGFLSYQYKK